MIFVDRQQRPEPRSLRTAQANQARAGVRQRLGSSSKELLAQSRVSFDAKVWIGAKPALATLFHGKCAYCESDCTRATSGEIEHFRPKMVGGDSGSGLGGERHLYYAWLAYEWNNLLLSCQVCNRSKRDRFPVASTRARLLASINDCRQQESGTLLDPCHDDPGQHITFADSGACVAVTERGTLTIDVLDLNRNELVLARRRAIDQVATLLALIDQRSAKIQPLDVLSNIVAATRADAQYAGAVRACLSLAIDKKLGDPKLVKTAVKPLKLLQVMLRKEGWYKPAHAAAAPSTPRATTPRAATPRPAAPKRQRYSGRRALPPHALARLSRIEIRNFKAIEEIAFDIPQPPEEAVDQNGALILLGENAAGKSSVLEAVALALLGTEQAAKLGLDGKRFIRRGPSWQSLNRSASVVLCFDGETKPSVSLSIDPKTGEFKGTNEPQTVLLGYGPRRYFTEARGQRRNANPFSRLATIFEPTTTLPNPKEWLLQRPQNDFNAAIRALREVMLLKEDALVDRETGPNGQPIDLSIALHGIATPIDHLSDGYRTVVATVVDVMREMLSFWPDLEQAQGIVLIDELDTHLHPRWKMRILERLRKSMRRVQFIATTHDPLCLRGAFDGEVQVLQRDADGHIECLANLPNVQGLSVEQLLMSDFFGLMSTEDPAVEREFIRYTALAAKTARSAEEQAELETLRAASQQRMKLGRSPQAQLLYESAGTYVRQQAMARPAERLSLSRSARERLAQAWAATAPAKRRR